MTDSRRLWRGLKSIMDYKMTSFRTANISLAEEISKLLYPLEVNTTISRQDTTSKLEAPAEGRHAASVSVHDMRRRFRRVTTKKVYTLDGISDTGVHGNL